MHYSVYRIAMQQLQDSVQPMMLIPLKEMEDFLIAAMEASSIESELEKRKMRSAEGQLGLIRLSLTFSAGIQELLEENSSIQNG